MLSVPRYLLSIENEKPTKTIVVFGARRVGKTTLLRAIVKDTPARWFNGDRSGDREELHLATQGDVRALLDQAPTLVVDEAQKIPDIGLTLKMLVDENERRENPVRIFVTGSSSFRLAQGVKESALGRLKMYEMWPLSFEELVEARGLGEAKSNLAWHLIYGMYPEVCMRPDEARETLENYCEGLLYKDLFALSGIRSNQKFEHLVFLLASSIGSEVNYDSLARETGLNKGTVANYITLLEECFIVKVCPSYAKNEANELKKGKKVYFCDNGIRNTIVRKFEPFSARDDAGALWENFFFMERVKWHGYKKDFAKLYFWRQRAPKSAQVDLVEDIDGKLSAFECKVSAKGKIIVPEDFKKLYSVSHVERVSCEQIEKFLL